MTNHLQPLQQLLHTKMDRKRFLRTVGLMVLVVVGLGFLVKQPAGKKTARATTGVTDDYGKI